MTTQSLSSAEWLNQAMAKVYGCMTAGLLTTALVAFLTFANPGFQHFLLAGNMKWITLFSPLAFVIIIGIDGLSFSVNTLRVLFLSYAAVNGLSLSIIGNAYSPALITSALISTMGTFGAMSLYGYFTKKDLTSLGGFLFMALIGVLIAMIANMFIGSTVLGFVVNVVAILVFLGFTAYDTQKIREILWEAGDDGRATVMGALTLYLDFVNLFLQILRFFGVAASSSSSSSSSND